MRPCAAPALAVLPSQPASLAHVKQSNRDYAHVRMQEWVQVCRLDPCGSSCAGCPLAGGLAAARQGLVPGAGARHTPLVHAVAGAVLAFHADLQGKVALSGGSKDWETPCRPARCAHCWRAALQAAPYCRL